MLGIIQCWKGACASRREKSTVFGCIMEADFKGFSRYVNLAIRNIGKSYSILYLIKRVEPPKIERWR